MAETLAHSVGKTQKFTATAAGVNIQLADLPSDQRVLVYLNMIIENGDEDSRVYVVKKGETARSAKEVRATTPVVMGPYWHPNRTPSLVSLPASGNQVVLVTPDHVLMRIAPL